MRSATAVGQSSGHWISLFLPLLGRSWVAISHITCTQLPISMLAGLPVQAAGQVALQPPDLTPPSSGTCISSSRCLQRQHHSHAHMPAAVHAARQPQSTPRVRLCPHHAEAVDVASSPDGPVLQQQLGAHPAPGAPHGHLGQVIPALQRSGQTCIQGSSLERQAGVAGAHAGCTMCGLRASQAAGATGHVAATATPGWPTLVPAGGDPRKPFHSRVVFYAPQASLLQQACAGATTSMLQLLAVLGISCACTGCIAQPQQHCRPQADEMW